MKKKNMILTVALATSAVFSAGLFTLNANKVSADGDFNVADFQMLEGASARYSITAETEDERYENSGIRFHAVLPTETYNTFEGAESETVKVSYGMIIAPYSYYSRYAEFNADTVFGINGGKKYYWEGDEAQAEGQKQILNITYDTLQASEEEGHENYHEIKGSITKILSSNYAKEFIGRAYVKYQDGESVKYDFAEYLNGDETNSVRSPALVAQYAEDKGLDCAEWLKGAYLAPVTSQNATTTYTLETYVGENLVKSEVVENVKVNETLSVEAQAYEGFTFVAEESKTQGRVYANGKLTLKLVYEEVEGSKYQVVNGGFENGLDGWTVNGDIGNVSSQTHYWTTDTLAPGVGFPFGLDGTQMFSAYEGVELEKNMGYLQSSVFTVSEAGWLTYKLGGAKNNDVVYLDVIDANTHEILKRYSNQNHKYEEVNGVRLGCELNAYKANLAGLQGKEVYIRVSDFATSDFGLFFLDSVNALHIAEPDENYTLANEVAHQATIYDLYNGDFSEGMAGWAKSSNIGDISESASDWFGNFNNVGKYFSCYAPDQSEGAKGTLRSRVFEIGGSGWITFHLGGMKNLEQVYMEVIDAQTGITYGRFYNQNIPYSSIEPDKLSCELVKYKADLSAYIGKLVYINFVDNATSDYGLIFCDEIKTNYENASDITDEYILASGTVNDIYNVFNGGFETGNLLGWTLVSGEMPGFITDENYYWKDANLAESRKFNKEGTYLFTGVETMNHGLMEVQIGTLRSNTFILKQNSSISFRLGGCRSAEGDYAVCVRVVNALTGEVIGEYNNPNRQEAVLMPYTHDLGNTGDVACYVELVDNATGDWGLIAIDAICITQKA